jgi:uncharacterized protein (UPF0264 family)
MTKLLVSVRDGQEALAALAGGASVIDVKEPRRGALGAGSKEQLAEVASVVAGRAPLSAALGELLDGPSSDLVENLSSYSFLKVGMAGCARVPSWPRLWSDFIATVSTDVAVVAVIYADHATAFAPTPVETLEVACELGVSYLLIDTFDKSNGDLLRHLRIAELAEIIATAHQSQRKVAVAGSLSRAMLPEILCLAPDFIAVRGAACRGGRSGQVDSALVRQLAGQLSTTNSHIARSSRREFVDSDVRES